MGSLVRLGRSSCASEAAGEEVVPGALKYLGTEGHDQERRSPAGSPPSGEN